MVITNYDQLNILSVLFFNWYCACVCVCVLTLTQYVILSPLEIDYFFVCVFVCTCVCILYAVYALLKVHCHSFHKSTVLFLSWKLVKSCYFFFSCLHCAYCINKSLWIVLFTVLLPRARLRSRGVE